MTVAALAGAFFASMLYILSPGPGVLALVGIGASRGRGPAARFIAGHMAGDFLWCTLAIVSLVGVGVLDTRVLTVLALFCGGYLTWLGLKGVMARSLSASGDMIGTRPLTRGVVFGLTNPKSYPVALAMFTALLEGQAQAGHLGLGALPALVGVSFVGFVVADLILVWLVGTSPMRRLYSNHALAVIRTTGAIFVLFGFKTLYDVVSHIVT